MSTSEVTPHVCEGIICKCVIVCPRCPQVLCDVRGCTTHPNGRRHFCTKRVTDITYGFPIEPELTAAAKDAWEQQEKRKGSNTVPFRIPNRVLTVDRYSRMIYDDEGQEIATLSYVDGDIPLHYLYLWANAGNLLREADKLLDECPDCIATENLACTKHVDLVLAVRACKGH